MKIGEAEKYAGNRLKNIFDQREAFNIADLVMEDVTGLSRIDRLKKKDEVLEAERFITLGNYLLRLEQNEPVQYILQKAWFYGLKLFVNEHVLIPRPETEELVEWLIGDIKKSGKDVFEKGWAEADHTTSLKILDVGTGSGCIALALKKHMPAAEVWGCDTSEEALNIARQNASALNLRIDFQGLDFLDIHQQKQLPTADILISNPPYIPMEQKQQMAKRVVDHEPHVALFVQDEDPYVFYRALASFGKRKLHENGNIYMEIEENASREVIGIFRKENYRDIILKNDLQGRNRMIRVTI